MISTIVSAAEQQRKRLLAREAGQLVHFPFNTDFKDRLAYMDSAVYGVNGSQLAIEQVQGRGALRARSSNMGLRMTVPTGKKKLLTPDLKWWALEVEVMIANPGIYKQESILLLHDSINDPDANYKLWMWKRTQSGDRMIFNTIGSTAETAPAFSDPSSFPGGAFRKYRLEKEQGTNWVNFYIDGKFISRQQIANRDFTTGVITVRANPTPNHFDGWLRELKVYGG